MIELLISFVGAVLIFFIDSVFWKVFVFAIMFVFIITGIYSMYFGAPFIPTNDKKLKTILKFGNFSKNGVVFDLGCGDGKIIREIAKCGVKEAIGYEFSIPTYFLAKLKTFFAKGKEKIIFGNFWKKDFSNADVLVCYLLIKSMKDFEKIIWPKLKKGTRVISNEFKMENVSHDEVCDRVYLYIKK